MLLVVSWFLLACAPAAVGRLTVPVIIFLAILELAVAQLPASEKAALEALYTATVGDNWTSKVNWMSQTDDGCTWERVYCQGVAPSHVTCVRSLCPRTVKQTRALYADPLAPRCTCGSNRMLDLQGYNLVGTIPDAISALSMLEYVDRGTGQSMSCSLFFLETRFRTVFRETQYCCLR
jgi:hypothetical protein